MIELLRETLPFGVAVFTPPNWDREYTECYGFSLEDIFAFGLKLIRQRWRTIGYPTEEMPPGVFPFDHEMSEHEIATNQVKLLEAGVIGEPGAGRSPGPRRSCSGSSSTSSPAPPTPAPPTARRSSTSGASSDADPWHMVVDNGSTRAEPGEAPRANVTFETSWADWVLSTRPGMSPVRSILTGKIRPRGKVRELLRMRKVFPG